MTQAATFARLVLMHFTDLTIFRDPANHSETTHS